MQVWSFRDMDDLMLDVQDEIGCVGAAWLECPVTNYMFEAFSAAAPY